MSYIGYTGERLVDWIPAAISSIVVGLRVLVRTKLQIFGVEDWLMLASWLSLIISCSLDQAGDDLFYSTPVDGWTYQLSSQYISETTATSIWLYLCLFFGKTSVAVTLLRLIGRTSRWRRWLVVSSLVVLTIITLTTIVTRSIIDCSDPNYLGKGICDVVPNLQARTLDLFTSYSAFSDFLYSIIPGTIIYKVQVKRGRKLLIALLLSMGWLAGVFAIVRGLSTHIFQYDPRPGFGAAIDDICFSVETALLVICGSLATLTPLVDYAMYGKPLRARDQLPSTQAFGGHGRTNSGFTKLEGQSLTTIKPGSSHTRPEAEHEELTALPREGGNSVETLSVQAV